VKFIDFDFPRTSNGLNVALVISSKLLWGEAALGWMGIHLIGGHRLTI